jgi:3-oxoacyl-[acyl-carrier-protein] synthase II
MMPFLTRAEAGQLIMTRRVVITGMEVTTAIGTGLEKFWSAALAGTSGIRRIAAYDPSPYTTQIAGEVIDFPIDEYPEYKKSSRYPRASQFILYCARKLIEKSGFSMKSPELLAMGTFIGTGHGGTPEIEDAFETFYRDSWKKVQVLTIIRAMANSPANNVAIELGLGGPNVTISNACNSSAEAIAYAFNQIRSGRLSAAVAGGTETMIFETTMAAWCRLRVMSTYNEVPEKASRPFDKTRDGMIMAEGAGLLMLEELSHAKARGATIYGEIIGTASACDASHITAPSVDGQARAIQLALKDAQIEPHHIDYISAHGTGTILNDQTETQTIKKVFGSKAGDIPISSLKSMVGHTIGASGALEIVATALSLKEGRLHPTINLNNPDPDCDLDYIPNVARILPIETALSNHFAFGGANTALILRRYPV